MTAKLTSTGVVFGDGSTQTTALDATGVTAATYGSASAIPVLTINANGVVTSASTASVSVPANCTNCSSYTSLTSKPSIPSNCTNCSNGVSLTNGTDKYMGTGNGFYLNTYNQNQGYAPAVKQFYLSGTTHVLVRNCNCNCRD